MVLERRGRLPRTGRSKGLTFVYDACQDLGPQREAGHGDSVSWVVWVHVWRNGRRDYFYLILSEYLDFQVTALEVMGTRKLLGP